MPYLLDTNAVIALMKGHPATTPTNASRSTSTTA
jgi:predicted nucleic acid-binding protein